MSSLIVRHATEVTDCKGSSMFERDKKKVRKCTGQGDLAHQPLDGYHLPLSLQIKNHDMKM